MPLGLGGHGALARSSSALHPGTRAALAFHSCSPGCRLLLQSVSFLGKPVFSVFLSELGLCLLEALLTVFRSWWHQGLSSSEAARP